MDKNTGRPEEESIEDLAAIAPDTEQAAELVRIARDAEAPSQPDEKPEVEPEG